MGNGTFYDIDVDAVRREWEGRETPLGRRRCPVEPEPIRRHCHMLDDANSLFSAALIPPTRV